MRKRLIISGNTSRSGTSITQRIINFHPDIWVTNESRLYYWMFKFNDPKEYFESFLNKNPKFRVDYPPDFDRDTFVERCMSKLKEDTPISRVEVAESEIFKEDWKYVGDKGFPPQNFVKLVNEGIDFKLVYIHRDGRDVVNSMKRTGIPAILKGSDITTLSTNWAFRVEKWLEARESISKDKYVEIMYEDWIDDPEVNIDKITSLLGLDKAPFVLGYDYNFSRDYKRTHRGGYKKKIPNWKELFDTTAINVLEKIGYEIGE